MPARTPGRLQPHYSRASQPLVRRSYQLNCHAIIATSTASSTAQSIIVARSEFIAGSRSVPTRPSRNRPGWCSSGSWRAATGNRRDATVDFKPMAAGRRSHTKIVTPDGKLPFGGVDRGPIAIPHQRDGDTTQKVWMLPFHWLALPYAQQKILTAELPLTLYPGASLGRLRILPGACQDVRRGTQVPEGALGAGEQFHLPRAPAATVVAHSIEDVTDRHVTLRHVGLVDHAVLPAAVAGDAHEPRRERPERRGLLRRSAAGRRRGSASAASGPGGGSSPLRR